jgi:hypothetical protein
VTLYKCPSCGATGKTSMHSCPSFGGLPITRLVVKGEDDKPDGTHVVIQREDYVGTDGAMAAVSTVRPDGSNDLTVIPMVARSQADGAKFYRRHNWRDPELQAMARLAARYDLRMAWTASAVFAYAMLLLLQKTGQNLPSDSYKAALYASSAMTPDKTVSTAALTQYAGAGSQWVAANENVGAGYTAGGVALSGVSLAQAAGIVNFTAADTVWTAPVTVSAYGNLVYDTTAANDGLCYNYFGSVQSVTAGGFNLHWANGIMAVTT